MIFEFLNPKMRHFSVQKFKNQIFFKTKFLIFLHIQKKQKKENFETNLSVIGLSRTLRRAKIQIWSKIKNEPIFNIFQKTKNMWIVTPFYTKMPNLGVLGSNMWILGSKNDFWGFQKILDISDEIFAIFFSFSISSVIFWARPLIFFNVYAKEVGPLKCERIFWFLPF